MSEIENINKSDIVDKVTDKAVDKVDKLSNEEKEEIKNQNDIDKNLASLREFATIQGSETPEIDEAKQKALMQAIDEVVEEYKDQGIDSDLLLDWIFYGIKEEKVVASDDLTKQWKNSGEKTELNQGGIYLVNVKNTKLNIRNENGEVIGVAKSNDKVAILSNKTKSSGDYIFYNVKTKDFDNVWVSSKFLKKEEPVKNETTPTPVASEGQQNAPILQTNAPLKTSSEFAPPPSRVESPDLADERLVYGLNEKDKINLISKLATEQNEQQKVITYRENQFNIFKLYIDSLDKEAGGGAKTWEMKLMKMLGKVGITDSRTQGINKAIEEIKKFYPDIEAGIKEKPFEEVMEKQGLEELFSEVESILKVDFNEPKDKKDLNKLQYAQYNQLITHLRDIKHYAEAQTIMEGLLGKEFEEGIKSLTEDQKAEFKTKSSEKAFSLASKNISFWNEQWEEMGIPQDKREECRNAQLKAIEDEEYSRLCNQASSKFLDNLKGVSISAEKKQLWEQYNDMLDPKGEWRNLKDETWDTIIEEVAINAPLILVSGGIAAVARTTMSMGAKYVIGRMALRQAVKGGVKFTAKELTEYGGKALGKNLLGKTTGVVAGMGVEGAVFELTNMGLHGEKLWEMPDALQRIVFSSLTLGAFHGSGKLSEKLFTKTVINEGKSETKAVLLGRFTEKINNKAFRELTKQVIAKGHIEAATMLIAGAIQEGYMEGDIAGAFEKLLAGDEESMNKILHAYIAVGALKVAGGVISTAQGKVFKHSGAKERGGDVRTNKAKEIFEEATSLSKREISKMDVSQLEKLNSDINQTLQKIEALKKIELDQQALSDLQKAEDMLNFNKELVDRNLQILKPKDQKKDEEKEENKEEKKDEEKKEEEQKEEELSPSKKEQLTKFLKDSFNSINSSISSIKEILSKGIPSIETISKIQEHFKTISSKIGELSIKMPELPKLKDFKFVEKISILKSHINDVSLQFSKYVASLGKGIGSNVQKAITLTKIQINDLKNFCDSLSQKYKNSREESAKKNEERRIEREKIKQLRAQEREMAKKEKEEQREKVRKEREEKERRLEEARKKEEQKLKIDDAFDKISEIASNTLNAPKIIESKHGEVVFGTDKGENYRSYNEDRIFVDTNKDLYISIDGMGGMGGKIKFRGKIMASGEVAAQIFAEVSKEGAERGWNMDKIQDEAHLRMKESGVADGGACYAAAKIEGNVLNTWHAGDVKIIVIGKDGEIRFETKDHNLAERGEPNVVTNSVQGTERGTAERNKTTLQDGDVIIQASDGLWDNFSPKEVALMIKGLSPKEAIAKLNTEVKNNMVNAKQLISQGKSAKPDNINIILHEFNAEKSKIRNKKVEESNVISENISQREYKVGDKVLIRRKSNNKVVEAKIIKYDPDTGLYTLSYKISDTHSGINEYSLQDLNELNRKQSESPERKDNRRIDNVSYERSVPESTYKSAEINSNGLGIHEIPLNSFFAIKVNLCKGKKDSKVIISKEKIGNTEYLQFRYWDPASKNMQIIHLEFNEKTKIGYGRGSPAQGKNPFIGLDNNLFLNISRSHGQIYIENGKLIITENSSIKNPNILGEAEIRNFVNKKCHIRVNEEVYRIDEFGQMERGWFVQKINGDGTLELKRSNSKKTFNVKNNEVLTILDAEGRIEGNVSPKDQKVFEERIEKILETKSTLSKKEFDQLFENKAIKQQNIGNCYFLAGINSLRNSNFFEFLMRTSIKKSGRNWEVKIPFGKADAKIITVTPEDIKPQTEKSSGKVLHPVQGPDGYKILEAAFLRNIMENYNINKPVDRRAMEGGLGHQPLRRLFDQNSIHGLVLDADGGNVIKKEKFVTELNFGNHVSLANGKQSAKKLAENLLDDFDPNRDIFTCGTTPHRKGDQAVYKVGGKEFFHSHDYSIVRTDPQNRTVIVANPHDTGRPILLTYKEFMKTFTDISGAQLLRENITDTIQQAL